MIEKQTQVVDYRQFSLIKNLMYQIDTTQNIRLTFRSFSLCNQLVVNDMASRCYGYSFHRHIRFAHATQHPVNPPPIKMFYDKQLSLLLNQMKSCKFSDCKILALVVFSYLLVTVRPPQFSPVEYLSYKLPVVASKMLGFRGFLLFNPYFESL